MAAAFCGLCGHSDDGAAAQDFRAPTDSGKLRDNRQSARAGTSTRVRRKTNGLDIERPETGPRGAFPVRFPVGKFLALVVVIGLVPVWWKVGAAHAGRVKTFYARTYWTTLADSASAAHAPDSRRSVCIGRSLWGMRPPLAGH